MALSKIESKLITCILPHGTGHALLKTLSEKKQIHTANVHSCRGTGTSSPVGGKEGVGQQQEKDVLYVSVPTTQADEIFEFIYFEAGVDRPHGGFMYMGPLTYTLPFTLPDLPRQE